MRDIGFEAYKAPKTGRRYIINYTVEANLPTNDSERLTFSYVATLRSISDMNSVIATETTPAFSHETTDNMRNAVNAVRSNLLEKLFEEVILTASKCYFGSEVD